MRRWPLEVLALVNEGWRLEVYDLRLRERKEPVDIAVHWVGGEPPHLEVRVLESSVELVRVQGKSVQVVCRLEDSSPPQ